MTATILLGLDPFDWNEATLARINHSLDLYLEDNPGRVVPFYVLAPRKGGFDPFGFREIASELETLARRQLDHVVAQLNRTDIAAPQVLRVDSRHRSDAVGRVNEMVQKEGADLIAVTTQSPSRYRPYRLGSFTESLLLHSPFPVLSFDPISETPNRPGKGEVLMPVDHESELEESLRAVTNWVTSRNFSLVLFHAMMSSFEFWFHGAAPTYFNPGKLISSRLSTEQENRRHWLEGLSRKWANSEVPCEPLMSLSTSPVPESIVATAGSRKTSLIAMPSAGPMDNYMAGSVTREVVRSASCPVWTLTRGSEG